MSTSDTNGRPRKAAGTDRGKMILATLDAQGLTLKAAAAKAGISFDALHRVIHEADPGWLQVRTVAAVCEHLGLALELVAPCIAKLVGRPADSAEPLAAV